MYHRLCFYSKKKDYTNVTSCFPTIIVILKEVCRFWDFEINYCSAEIILNTSTHFFKGRTILFSQILSIFFLCLIVLFLQIAKLLTISIQNISFYFRRYESDVYHSQNDYYKWTEILMLANIFIKFMSVKFKKPREL